MIDYQEIVEGLDENRVKQLLDSLQIPYRDQGGALIMPTVCHNSSVDEASWKLYYYKNTHLFMCYTEDGTMSIFKFLKHFYETRSIEYDWYRDIFQVILNCSASSAAGIKNPMEYKSRRADYELRKNRRQLPTYPKGILEVFVKKYPVEWLNDHISREAMDKFDILYSIAQNKIIIPHFDASGALVGIRGRALNPWEVENVGKYMPVQIENKWYSHPLSLNLYGLEHTKENIKKYGICYVFESEKSVLQFESFSLPNCAVAACGSNLNKFQVDLLLRYCAPHEIVVCFDNEELAGQHKYFDKLYSMCKKYKNYCNMSFIYDRKNITKLKDSPSDNGEEIFKQLLERRVFV